MESITMEQIVRMFEYLDGMPEFFTEMAKENQKSEEEKEKYLKMLIQCVYIEFLILGGPRTKWYPISYKKYLMEIIGQCQNICTKVLIANEVRAESFKKFEKSLQQDYAEIRMLIENNFEQYSIIKARLDQRANERDELVKMIKNFMDNM